LPFIEIPTSLRRFRVVILIQIGVERNEGVGASGIGRRWLAKDLAHRRAGFHLTGVPKSCEHFG
jgi:hypothetical protein